jgi:large subunit ribosomal protein L2
MGKRIIARRRGRGGSNYQAPSNRYRARVIHPPFEGKGRIDDIVHCPGHSAPLIKVTFTDKNGSRELYYFATEGKQVGQTFETGPKAPVESGNTVLLGDVPEGHLVHNIESHPGDGGKFVRTAGTAGVVVTHGTKTMVQMPSGQLKMFNPRCRATVGVVAGGGRGEKPIVKAGKGHHMHRSKAAFYPRVKGVCMNPVDHPHGGGSHQHVGRPNTVGRNAPPGMKVGRLSPQKKNKKKY